MRRKNNRAMNEDWYDECTHKMQNKKRFAVRQTADNKTVLVVRRVPMDEIYKHCSHTHSHITQIIMDKFGARDMYEIFSIITQNFFNKLDCMVFAFRIAATVRSFASAAGQHLL